ncbi:MAG: hypothetical protein FJ104_08030, partial [Deltaproteobacteria bacterium]|nr:hypothetical protein [Deltaproteobacteria bacterium]
DIAYGAGITLGLAGLAWFLAPEAGPGPATGRVRVAPVLGTRGGGAAARLAF